MHKLYEIHAKQFKGSVILGMLPFAVSLDEATAYSALLFRKGWYYVSITEAVTV